MNSNREYSEDMKEIYTVPSNSGDMNEIYTVPNNNFNLETRNNNVSSKSKMKKVIISILVVTTILILILAVLLYATFWPKLCPKGTCTANPLTSCTSVVVPGYYWVTTNRRTAVPVYCAISPCGNSGSWMRVTKIDMEKDNCPNSLCLNTAVRRSCRICHSNPGCSSDLFSTNGVRYSKVCGRIISYQIGTPDAFSVSRSPARRTINEVYVDGVSLTYGVPRKHIWTFAADHTENSSFASGCRCNTYLRRPQVSPDFVGNNYFCDTADPVGLSFNLLFWGNPLWDGAGCGPTNNCCSFNRPPWFYRKLPRSTAEAIEMRMCRGETSENEDMALKIVELYVQ